MNEDQEFFVAILNYASQWSEYPLEVTAKAFKDYMEIKNEYPDMKESENGEFEFV